MSIWVAEGLGYLLGINRAETKIQDVIIPRPPAISIHPVPLVSPEAPILVIKAGYGSKFWSHPQVTHCFSVVHGY